MAEETELINDQYWLKYAQKTVENSITARNDAAAKLEKMTLWFWGLYTASFTIGVSINLIKAPLPVLVLLASPIATLIITYWLCVRAQLPVMAKFDPRIPYEIKEAYNEGLKIKYRRFVWSLIFTFISALLLCSALTALSFVEKKEKENYGVSAFLNDAKDTLVISGTLPKDVVVNTVVDSLNSKKNKILVYSNTFKIQENGILNLNVPLKKVPKTLIVTATWQENKVEKGFAQLFTR